MKITYRTREEIVEKVCRHLATLHHFNPDMLIVPVASDDYWRTAPLDVAGLLVVPAAHAYPLWRVYAGRVDSVLRALMEIADDRN